jgi:hypothetical protein
MGEDSNKIYYQTKKSIRGWGMFWMGFPAAPKARRGVAK